MPRSMTPGHKATGPDLLVTFDTPLRKICTRFIMKLRKTLHSSAVSTIDDFVLIPGRSNMLKKETPKIVFPALFQKIDEFSKGHCI